MKRFNVSLFGIAAMLLTATQAFAEGGGVHGGGGDVVTEKRIKDIRDNLLFDFINKGGDRQLDFKGKLSFSDYENGNTSADILSMKELLTQGRVIVNAIAGKDQNQNDELKNTFVDGARKICKSVLKAKQDGKAYIICDADTFQVMDANLEKNADLQTVQVAHEYHALAGIEKNIGPDSDYWLSSQLKSHMGYELVRKLVVSGPREAIDLSWFKGGDYASYEDGTVSSGFGLGSKPRSFGCVRHLEVDGTRLYIEYRDNPKFDITCVALGFVRAFDCRADSFGRTVCGSTTPTLYEQGPSTGWGNFFHSDSFYQGWLTVPACRGLQNAPVLMGASSDKVVYSDDDESITLLHDQNFIVEDTGEVFDAYVPRIPGSRPDYDLPACKDHTRSIFNRTKFVHLNQM